MQIEQTLVAEKLNHLAAILDDASEGYLTASLYARNRELEIFFEKLSYQRKDFALDIKRLIKSIGAPVYSKGGFLSLLHRTWKDMSYQLKSRDRDAVKTCCVIGEKFACNYYESILNDPQMPEPFKQVLASQLNSVNFSLQQYETSPAGVLKTSSEPAAILVKENGEKKIGNLISYLKQVAKDFEMIADEIEDKNLKNVFFALSEEDKQFAEELYNQVGLCGLSLSPYETTLRWDHIQEDNNPYQELCKENELMQICDKSEFLFLKLYTDALREFLSFKSLMEMMVYQYNSIRAGFLKLRMLNSLRYHNHPASIQ